MDTLVLDWDNPYVIKSDPSYLLHKKFGYYVSTGMFGGKTYWNLQVYTRL